MCLEITHTPLAYVTGYQRVRFIVSIWDELFATFCRQPLRPQLKAMPVVALDELVHGVHVGDF